jgi:hypothetical protein
MDYMAPVREMEIPKILCIFFITFIATPSRNTEGTGSSQLWNSGLTGQFYQTTGLMGFKLCAHDSKHFTTKTKFGTPKYCRIYIT